MNVSISMRPPTADLDNEEFRQATRKLREAENVFQNAVGEDVDAAVHELSAAILRRDAVVRRLLKEGRCCDEADG